MFPRRNPARGTGFNTESTEDQRAATRMVLGQNGTAGHARQPGVMFLPQIFLLKKTKRSDRQLMHSDARQGTLNS